VRSGRLRRAGDGLAERFGILGADEAFAEVDADHATVFFARRAQHVIGGRWRGTSERARQDECERITGLVEIAIAS